LRVLAQPVQSLCRSGDIVYGTNDITVSLTRSRIAGCARLSRSGEVHFPQNHAFPTSCIRWRDSKTLSLIAAMVGAPILVPRLEMLTDQIPKLRTGLERMVRALGTLHAAYITEWNTTHVARRSSSLDGMAAWRDLTTSAQPVRRTLGSS
jgi:hypothetical protein